MRSKIITACIAGLVFMTCSSESSREEMRVVDYVRLEFHAADEPRRALLPVFLMDVPYVLSSGVIPPLPLLNEILASGQLGGGMSPGARWQAFTLTDEEYDALVAWLLDPNNTPPEEGSARYVPRQIRVDPALADHESFTEWLRAVREKYGPSELRE